MLTSSRRKVSRSKVRRSKVRRSRSKVRRSKVRRSKVRRSKVRRSKVRRSKVRRSKVRRSRSKVRRSRSKVRRSRRKVRYDGAIEFDKVNDCVVILNSDISEAKNNVKEFSIENFTQEIKKNIAQIGMPYKLEYRNNNNYKTIISQTNSIDEIIKSIFDSKRNYSDVIVSNPTFENYIIFNENNKMLLIKNIAIAYATSKNKIEKLKYKIEEFAKQIGEKLTLEYKDNSGKTSYTKSPCNITDIHDAINDKNRNMHDIFVYVYKEKEETKEKESLLQKISTYTKLDIPTLKKILVGSGVTIATLAGIAFYLSQNKNMSKEEMKNYLVKMVNKNKK